MIKLTIEQAQQIEESLESCFCYDQNDQRYLPSAAEEALATIRAARAQEPAEQEPVGYWQGTFNTEGGAILYEVPQVSAFGYRYPNHPVYAYPVRTKDLTDKELDALWYGNTEGGWHGLFRAVIAADRERNRG